MTTVVAWNLNVIIMLRIGDEGMVVVPIIIFMHVGMRRPYDSGDQHKQT